MNKNRIAVFVALMAVATGAAQCWSPRVWAQITHQSVPELIEVLKHGDRSARFVALSRLMSLGQTAKEAVPVLTETLKHDKQLRFFAARALGRIGPAAVPALVEALKDNQPQVRCEAAKTLGHIGRPAKPAVPALIRLLADPDPLVRHNASSALAVIGPPAVPGLIDALRDDNVVIRDRVIETLGQMGPTAAQAVPALIEILSGERFLHAKSRDALAAIGPPAVLGLVELLTAPDAIVRTGAAQALGEIGPAAKAAAPALIATLHDEDQEVGTAAARALVGIGSAAVPHLVRVLHGDDAPRLRATVAQVLSEIAPDGVLALLQAAEAEDAQLQTLATDALARLGEDALFPLEKALKHKDARIRRRATFLVGEIGTRLARKKGILLWGFGRGLAHVVPADPPELLAAALKDQDEDVRLLAADGLRRIGPKAALVSAVEPELTRALQDNSPMVRRVAADALGQIGAHTDTAYRALVQALKDGDESLRYEAGAVLASHRAGLGKLARQLVEAFRSAAPEQRLKAAQAVVGAEPNRPKRTELGPLVEALLAGQEKARCMAMMLLAAKGPEATSAIPELRAVAASNRSTDSLRHCARWALLVIEAYQTQNREATSGVTPKPTLEK